jgi:hypothetical protein
MDKVIPHIKERFEEMYLTPLRLAYIDYSYARYAVRRTCGLWHRIAILGLDDNGRSEIVYNDYPEGDFICSMFGISNGELSHIFGLWLCEKFECKNLDDLSCRAETNSLKWN